MRLINAIFISLLTMVFIMVVFAVGPEIESRFWPVYSKFKIVSAEVTPEGDTIATFEFTKFRNCDPQGFAFFNGELGKAFYQITTRVEGTPSSRVRPLGTQISYPYVLKGITPEELANTVFAEIYSYCHPLWFTRSKVYP